MPRKRNKENRGLPERWRYKNGAYRYQVPAGLEHLWDGKKEFTLGKTLADAHRNWAIRIDQTGEATTVDALLDQYAALILPTKALRTQQTESPVVENLRKSFGHMPIDSVKPKHVYALKSKLGQRGKSTANRHIAVCRRR